MVAHVSKLLLNRCFLYLFGPSARDDHDDHDDRGDRGGRDGLALGTIH